MGSMKKLIIIPGWTYSTAKWINFSKGLQSKGRKLTILKVPGLTESSDKVWNLDSYVKWLNEKLKKEESVVLVGHSNGGRIAIAYAASFPKKLSKLVLIDSAGIFHNELPLRLKRFVFGTISAFGKKLGVSKNLRWIIYKIAREHDYERANIKMKETMKNIIYEDIIPLLRKITTPTLIIWGERDAITPLSDGKIMNNQIKDSKLFVIAEAKHSPFYTHAKKTLKIILEHI